MEYGEYRTTVNDSGNWVVSIPVQQQGKIIRVMQEQPRREEGRKKEREKGRKREEGRKKEREEGRKEREKERKKERKR